MSTPPAPATPPPPTDRLLTAPAPGTVVHPVFTYSDEQQALIAALREYAHSIALPASDAYAKWEQRWLARPDTVPRYARASKWRLDDAKKRLRGTLEWRRDYQPDLIPPEEVRVESETGKMILNGFDNDGRPILYLAPARENTPSSDRQLRHLVFILERAKDMQPLGQDSIVILIDYRGVTMRTNPSISVARKVLVILQHHYVETLGRGLVVFLPMLLNFFYKGISPFLDPVTRDKIRFNPDLTELIPRAQLAASFGGAYPYAFEPASYWAQLCANAGVAPDGTRFADVPRPAIPPLSPPPPPSPSPSPSDAHAARTPADPVPAAGAPPHARTDPADTAPSGSETSTVVGVGDGGDGGDGEDGAGADRKGRVEVSVAPAVPVPVAALGVGV